MRRCGCQPFAALLGTRRGPYGIITPQPKPNLIRRRTCLSRGRSFPQAGYLPQGNTQRNQPCCGRCGGLRRKQPLQRGTNSTIDRTFSPSLRSPFRRKLPPPPEAAKANNEASGKPQVIFKSAGERERRSGITGKGFPEVVSLNGSEP